jgi:glycosyltransferase involved in cell wall biosynthesis
VTVVSVVIPTYNAREYLAETLASVRDQTLQDVEVVLVDDGSTDDTLRVARNFGASLDLTIIAQANAGPAAARNAGINAARGQYCAFIDSDDTMIPTRLADQVAQLEAESDFGLVYSDLETFDDSGIIHATRRAFSNPQQGMILDHLLLDNFITTSTVMAPKERLIEAGLFDSRRRVSEDFDLWLRMAYRWKIGFVDRPLVRYRRRSGSLSDDKLRTGQSALNVIESFWQAHPEYAQLHPDLVRRSVARHLLAAGAAAATQRRRWLALSYLARALRLESGNVSTWKWLIKSALPSK